jgi:hypothetical protein
MSFILYAFFVLVLLFLLFSFFEVMIFFVADLLANSTLLVNFYLEFEKVNLL